MELAALERPGPAFHQGQPEGDSAEARGFALLPHKVLGGDPSTEACRQPERRTTDRAAPTTGALGLTALGAGSLRPSGRQGWFLLRPLSLACRQPSSPCVLTWPSVCVCVLISSYLDTVILDQGPFQ